MNLAGIGFHRAQAWIDGNLESNVFRDHPAQHPFHFGDDCVQVEDSRLQHTAFG